MGKYFTLEEYEQLVKPNQTDKNDKIVYLYTTDKTAQYSYVESAKAKGYDVLLLDGQLDVHFVNSIESKIEKSRFTRVDSDVVSKLIEKDEKLEVSIAQEDRNELIQVFKGVTPSENYYLIEFEELGENAQPMVITQNEFMRRMKDMGSMSGMNFYGEMPDSYNLVVNSAHPLVKKVLEIEKESLSADLTAISKKVKPLNKKKSELEEQKKDKKEEEIPQDLKDQISEVEGKINDLNKQKDEKLREFGKQTPLAKQLVDLALLANNMLKGEDLNVFVNRSVELLQK